MWVCRYSIAVITSVSQTEEAGSTPVICSSAERARAVRVAARKLAQFVRKRFGLGFNGFHELENNVNESFLFSRCFSFDMSFKVC